MVSFPDVAGLDTISVGRSRARGKKRRSRASLREGGWRALPTPSSPGSCSTMRWDALGGGWCSLGMHDRGRQLVRQPGRCALG